MLPAGVDVAEIGGHRRALVSGGLEPRRGSLRTVLVVGVDDHGRAERRKVLGDAEADARRRASDQGDLAGQRGHAALSVSGRSATAPT